MYFLNFIWSFSGCESARPRSDEVTERIHAAVFTILSQDSYRSLSMESIAARAGVGRLALYRRYLNVRQTVLGTIRALGPVVVQMPYSNDIGSDLRVYFMTLVAGLSEDSPAGRAFRGILAAELIDGGREGDFARFIEERRKPVRLRLLAWKNALEEVRLDCALDSLFGPILYHLLIRGVGVSGESIDPIVGRVLEGMMRGLY